MANLKDLIVNGSARILGTLYANLVGNASTATKLAASKTVQTNLASTAAANFDGSSNITPGVTGTLPVANGGTGQTSVANIQAGKDGDGNTISSTYAKKSTLATVATSGSYNDLSNKPTIPNVYNGSLSIYQGGTRKGTFSANASESETIYLDAPEQADWNETDTSSLAFIRNKPTIPAGAVVDQTYDATSANAQSGVAINGAGFVKPYTDALVEGDVLTYTTQGGSARWVNGHKYLKNSATGTRGLAINPDINQCSTSATNTGAIAIGDGAMASGQYSIQIGYGTNTNNGSLRIGFGSGSNYELLNGATGTIPYQRINSLTETRNSGQLKFWTGTRAQYDAITTKDANTLYNITDDTDATLGLLDLLYPIGAIYIGTCATCPLVVLGVGTWSLVASDRVLQGAGQNTIAGDIVSAGLPNITGRFGRFPYNVGADSDYTSSSGALSYSRDGITESHNTNSSGNSTSGYINFDASVSNSIYGNSITVQPPAFIVNIWQRIS